MEGVLILINIEVERAYHTILQKIRNGHYPIGEILNETIITNEICIGRKFIRVAIKRLRKEGVVESAFGIGTVVTKIR